MEQGDLGAAGQLIQKLSSALLVRAGMSQQPPADLELPLHQQMPSVTSFACILLVHLGYQCPFAPTVAMPCARAWPYVGPQGLGLIAAGCILRTKENLQMSGLREFAASFLFKFPKAAH